MSFKRSILPKILPSGEELTSCLVGIGVRLNGTPRRHVNIENTLIAASLEGLTKDGRVLSLLVDWLEIHHERINADRLVRLVLDLALKQPREFGIFWGAVAQWFSSDNRFAKLQKLAPKKRFPLLGERTFFLIEKHGEDLRFQKTSLLVPRGVLRHRPEDILNPHELVKIHSPYRFRILMGPSYRADMWALLYKNPHITAAKLARLTYGSYPTAFHAKKDFDLVRADFSVPHAA